MTIGPEIFFEDVNERQGEFHRRAFIFGALATAGMVGLGLRLSSLQLVEANRYRTLAASNQFNFRLVPPPRGRILDRNRIELAGNRANYRVMLARDGHNDVPATLVSLSDIIPLDPKRQVQLAKDIHTTPQFVPVSIADNLTWDQFCAINLRLPELAGVTADMGDVRVYPFGGAFAHVIGYVSKISADDLKAEGGDRPEPLLLNPGFRIGKQGIERSLDLDLRGKAGGQKVEVDAKGRLVRKDPEGDIPAKPGKEVVLTLDADIQTRALEVFGEESGAAVVMDVHTGDLLCLMSAPSFDANSFVAGMPSADYRALAGYERRPLLDKALSGTYPPGSTFKTMVALAALESGVDPKTVHVCGGVWNYGGHPWHCDRHHGALDMHQAIVTSCDIYFYQTALAVGPDKLADVARKFGLGQIFDIGLPARSQRPGLVPDRDFKRRRFPKDPLYHPGDTIPTGIGQGYLNINPLQSCVMVARLANGLKALQPRLVHAIGGVVQPSGAAVADLGADPQHIDFVRKAMADVVSQGTAKGAGDLGLGPIKMAGKTGTAQAHTYRNDAERKSKNLEWERKDHAWFVAFAPADAPRYALSVLVQHGGFGAAAAAPRAREIMRTTLLKDPEIRRRITASPPPAPPPTTTA